ncbi:MAG: cytochrome c-type biogenesis protein CcmH [Methylococcaceae bacterium]|nr:cytochrome c-type biogenesis protein CcmH [Methylococcaceae bacterium]
MMFRLFIIVLLSITSAYAAIETYEFKDKDKERRFHELSADMRCPKCQNQNLADSNAEIAQDLKQKIYQMLEADKSDMEIVDYMVARYGDFVLYEPRFNAQNAVLWLGPGALLLLGLMVVIWLTRSRHNKNAENAKQPPELDAKQQKQLQQVLNKDKKS